MNSNVVDPKEFTKEWNKVTGALKLEHADILDSIHFVSVESEWGKRTDVEKKPYVTSSDRLKNDWNKITSFLKRHKKVLNMPLAISSNAEIRERTRRI